MTRSPNVTVLALSCLAISLILTAPDVAAAGDKPALVFGILRGRYFGGGMHIGPGAKPDDGALYVVVVDYMSKPRLIANFPSIYRGTHLDHPAVSVHRGRRIDADGVPGEVWLDIDGEPLGTLPATIELLPSAITLFGVDA